MAYNGTGQGAYPRESASPLFLCLADKNEMRKGAMEMGKVLTPESRLLHVMPSRQEVDDNRCNGTGQGAYPGELPPPCCFQRARGR
jgi:hypothetical protein